MAFEDAAFQFAGSTALSLMSGAQNMSAIKRQYKYNKELAKIQEQINTRAFERQLSAASPSAIMERYKQAGIDINPQALLNSGASTSAPNMQPADAAPAPADYQAGAREVSNDIRSVLQNFVQLRQLKNNTDEVGARVLDVMGMNDLRSAQKSATLIGNKKLAKEIDAIILDNERKGIENEYLPSIQIANLQDIRSQIDYRIKQGELTDAQTANAYKTLDKIDAEIDNLRQSYRESESRVGWQNRRNTHYDLFGTDIGSPNAWSQGQGVVNKIVKGVKSLKPLYDKADSLYPGFRGDPFGAVVRGGILRAYGNYLKSKGKNLH